MMIRSIIRPVLSVNPSMTQACADKGVAMLSRVFPVLSVSFPI